MCGRWPSLWFFGRRVRSSATAVSPHAGTVGITAPSRRHFPTWTTMGTLVPAGTPLRVNLPSGPESATATGLPEGDVVHGSHVGPEAMPSSVLLGT